MTGELDVRIHRVAQAGQRTCRRKGFGLGLAALTSVTQRPYFILCQVLAYFCICEEVFAKDLVPKLGPPNPHPGPGIMVGPGEHLINAITDLAENAHTHTHIDAHLAPYVGNMGTFSPTHR